MPLSDDALNNWEQMATQACEAPPFMGRNNTKLYAAMVLDLVPELRAARKVVEAARAHCENVMWCDYEYEEGPGNGEIRDALAEYDALGTPQPQEQPA